MSSVHFVEVTGEYPRGSPGGLSETHLV